MTDIIADKDDFTITMAHEDVSNLWELKDWAMPWNKRYAVVDTVKLDYLMDIYRKHNIRAKISEMLMAPDGKHVVALVTVRRKEAKAFEERVQELLDWEEDGSPYLQACTHVAKV